MCSIAEDPNALHSGVENPYTELEKKRKINTSIPQSRHRLKKNYLKLNMQKLSSNNIEDTNGLARSIDFSDR